jgi:hypothetical protein
MDEARIALGSTVFPDSDAECSSTKAGFSREAAAGVEGSSSLQREGPTWGTSGVAAGLSKIRLLILLALYCLPGCDSSSGPTGLTSVASVQLSNTEITLAVGTTSQLTATPLNADGEPLFGRAVTWASSDPNIATVSTSGLVAGIEEGGPVTVTATSEGKVASANVTVTPPPVSEVVVFPDTLAVQLGTTIQLTAEILDSSGQSLPDRDVHWSSSDPAVLSVDSVGLATGNAEGGPVTVTATSEGISGTASVEVSWTILTGVDNPVTFVDVCPSDDPAYSRIRQDFEIRLDGEIISDAVTCPVPYSDLPVEDLTDLLIAVQTFRLAYYMSEGTEGHLPWTDQGLYHWMSENVDGVNLRSAAGVHTLDRIDGKTFVAQSVQSPEQREYKRNLRGLIGTLSFYAHEIRHADPNGGQEHTTGCEAFPNPTDPAGCDPSYELENLGSYGVQYWVVSSLATGYLNVGIGCLAPAEAQEQANRLAIDVNFGARQRFVSNVPPILSLNAPYGGPCAGWIIDQESSF